MLANINIEISWGAVAVLSSMVLTYLGTVGGLIWKLYAHSNDNQRHLNGNDKPVNDDLCKVKHRAIDNEIEDVRHYIGDVSARTTEAIKELKNDLNEKMDQMISLIQGK